MKKKVFYWSPHINRQVATVKAVINSAKSLSKYSKKFEPTIINAFGEWNDFSSELKTLNISKINIFNLNLKLPINGFLKSRIFYIFFSLIVFIPLIQMIKKEKPNYVIIHLITIPMLMASFFLKNETKFILRISGFPRLNFMRKFFWRISSKNLFKIFTPTKITKEILIKNKIFQENKIFLLEDPIIEIRKIVKLKKQTIKDFSKEMRYIVSIGRLTRQKNFLFLIKSFAKIKNQIGNTKLLIIGSGEEEKKLKQFLKKNKLNEDIFLMNYTENIFNYIDRSIFFVLTSNWEDPGFVLIEAAACNKLIISSEVESGPKEFINSQKNGLFFEKNNFHDFKSRILDFFNHKIENLDKIKLSAKIESKKYTIFNHYNKLKNYLED